jgi:vitamin B12 transport system substrate-binding protein
VSGWNAWPQLKAVKAQHLYAVPDKGLERASGQMLEAVAKLCERLSPDR